MRPSLLPCPEFPQVKRGSCPVTSPPDADYNCIAWAARDTRRRWWWPDPMGIGYWPEDAPREESVDAFVLAFGTLGYKRCGAAAFEAGFEKVAIYALRKVPTHAARQLPNGRWTSKLGEEVDIQHELGALCGPAYGEVVAILQREVHRAMKGASE